jgi:hypothetical protein
MASTQIILRKNKNAAARARRPNIYFCEGEFVATRAFFDPWGRGEGGVGSGEWGWGRGGGGGGKEERGRSNMQHREEGCHIYVFDLETFLLKYVFNVFMFLCFFLFCCFLNVFHVF